MSAGDAARFGKAAQTSKADELLNVDLIGSAGFGIGEIRQPLDFRRDLGEIAELGGRHAVPANCDQVLGHAPRSCVSSRPLPGFLLRNFRA
jgi:hypothetical protein